MGTIKINNKSIKKLYLGNIAVKRTYSNGSIVYDTGVQPKPQPCFEVVRTISQASGDYVDVYVLDKEKWYKKNNLSQYEEYGIMEHTDDLSSLTYYVGKLVLLDTNCHEYRWDGSQWVDLGSAGDFIKRYFLYTSNNDKANFITNINYYWGTGYRMDLHIISERDGTYFNFTTFFNFQNTSPIKLYSKATNLNIDIYYPASTTDNSVTSGAQLNIENFFSSNTYRGKKLIFRFENDKFSIIDEGTGVQISSTGSLNTITDWYNGLYSDIVNPQYGDSISYIKVYDANGNIVNDIRTKYNSGLSESRIISLYDYVTDTEYTNTTSSTIKYNSDYYGSIVPVIEYDTKVPPSKKVHYNTLSELELMECPWVGMRATIGENNDPYIYTANGWVIYTPTYKDQYLTIESLVDNNEIRWKINSSSSTHRQIYYSLDGNYWSSVFSNESGALLATLNTGDKLYLKGDHIKGSFNDQCIFSISGEYNLSGNLLSLIYMDDFSEKFSIQSTECFCETFSGTPIVSAENLVIPINNVPSNGLRQLFFNCTSLVSADISFISSVGSYGMFNMFGGCKNLKYIKLPSSTLTLSNYAMYYCFNGCSSLETNIILSVNDVYDNMCDNMFYGCTSLKEITINITNQMVSRNKSFSEMFKGCTSLERATINYYYNLPSASYSYQQIFGNMFNGCSSLSYIKAMFLTLPTGYYKQTDNWVTGVSASGTFVKNVNATWNVTGVYGVPEGWTIETANT